jgi:hypothetical protein
MSLNWTENELYKCIDNYIEDKEQAAYIFEKVASYLMSNFGEDSVTIKNFLCIMPETLYKETTNTYKSIYQDIMYIVLRYKAETGTTTGFPMKRYESVYNKNKAREEMLLKKQQARYEQQHKEKVKQRRKQAKQVYQDFDETKLITLDNILNNIKSKADIELITNYDNIYVKQHINERNGKLLVTTPYRDKSIKDGSIYWICLCDCGGFIVLRSNRLKDFTSCGHCDGNDHNYIGEKVGHLTCIDQKGLVGIKHTMCIKLKLKCDCGSEIIVTPKEFESGVRQYCNKQCKYGIAHREDVFKDNGDNFRPIFFKGTNVGKIGRKETNSNSTTGYLGVSYSANSDTYLAYITFQGKRENLGYYKTPELAYKVRMSAQNILHTEFLNELDDDEFIHNNKHLAKLLNKVKVNLQTNIQEMKN